MRGARGGDDFILRRIRAAEGDVFPDGAGFEPGFLQHHAIGCAQASARKPAYIAAIHAHRAAVHIVKAHQEIDERGFSAPRGADDCNALPAFCGHGKVLDQRAGGVVGKPYVLKRNIPPHILKRLCIRRVRLFSGRVDQLEHARRAGEGVLQFRYYAGNFVERLGVLVGIAQKAGEAAHRDAARYGGKRACNAHRRINEAVYKAGGRVGDGGKEDRAQRGFGKPVVDLIKPVEHGALPSERLHDLLVAHHFLNERGLLAARFGLQLEHGISALCDERRHEQGHGRDDNHHERNAPVERKHEAERA